MRVISLIEVRSQISYRAEIFLGFSEIFLFPIRDFERFKKTYFTDTAIMIGTQNYIVGFIFFISFLSEKILI